MQKFKSDVSILSIYLIKVKMPASLGKFNHSFNPIGKGDVVLILDKVKHTLPV